MKFFKAKEIYFSTKRTSGILTIFPYQFAIGVSVGFWPCITTIRFRLYFGFFKLALSISPGKLIFKEKEGG